MKDWTTWVNNKLSLHVGTKAVSTQAPDPDWHAYTIDHLRELLKAHDMSTAGTKQDKVDRVSTLRHKSTKSQFKHFPYVDRKCN